ncbi:unnamed protein product [Darwinula stevensoni]|uniref:4-hydroxythreonine-4-phosphate dehydrogenase n=1 Tax=Darwinula stevensoni TaxID=69355 RepID=A0A7R9AJP4_9CRUS|nr:unnamed protein product [Darwinula stevensoni]CAG0908153.1 unnamed protein product [Darwinula stevensoni]
MADCVVVGDQAHIVRAMQIASAASGLAPLPISVLPDLSAWSAHKPTMGLPLLQTPQIEALSLPTAPLVAWGQTSAQAGQLAAQAVQTAAMEVLQGRARALVTAPLNKASLHLAGYPYPGHTEMLQALSAAYLGISIEELPVRMMLANQQLSVVLDSIHVPLRAAVAQLNGAHLLQTLQITHTSWLRHYGFAPRIAVAGLNPHAGESGLLGDEEINIITPALELASQRGLQVSGPHPPDTVFMSARNTQPKLRSPFADVVVALYHDQGLIPVKYLGVDDGINITLGLPFVRTSPDHGTAFELAGKGKARAESLLGAINQARELSKRT